MMKRRKLRLLFLSSSFLAIGKQGQNVRLAAKLTGYGIDIKSEAEPEEHTEEENLEEEYVEPSEISLDEE